MNKPRLLIADDDPDICEQIVTVAADAGFQCKSIRFGSDFDDAYDQHRPDLILLDLKLPGKDGVEILHFLGSKKSTSQIVLISGMDTKTLHSAQKLAVHYGLGVFKILQKPFTLENLEKVLLEYKQRTAEELHSSEISPRDILKGLANEELVVHYQPKVLVQRDHVPVMKSAEALIRWRHPSLGMLPPKEFIPVAEHGGIIDRITDFVMKDAAQNVVKWQDAGLEMTVSVNISQSILSDISLADHYEQIVRDNNAATEQIMLEVTETSVMSDPVESLAALTRARLKGFSLSLDDFGTGSSSLAHLYRMPFNELKVDRMFVMDCIKDAEALEIVRFLIDLGEVLDVDICLEGVEDGAFIDRILREAPLLIQGYHFAAAMPPGELTRFATSLQNLGAVSQLVS